VKTRDWLETLQTRAAKVARVSAGFCSALSILILTVATCEVAGGNEHQSPARKATAVKMGGDWLRAIPRAQPVVRGTHRLENGTRQIATRIQPLASSRPAPPSNPPSNIRSRRSGAEEFVYRSSMLSRRGLSYQFGAADPSGGGLDCSGTILYLLKGMGISGVPRTASAQYLWLEKRGTLSKVRPWSSPQGVLKKLRPGDLLFWKGTYDTGRYPNVSHVMIYLGRDSKTGQPLMFGASSRKTKGRNGNGVDIYPFNYPKKKSKGRFVGFGRVPGF